LKKVLIIITALFVVLTMLGGCAQQPPKLSELTIATSPGPITYPLAKMKEDNLLSNIADKTTINAWATGDQLTAMVTSNQVQFAASPLTNAMMLYNKGVKVKLINVSVWGMLYVISSDQQLKSLDQLKGKTVAVVGGQTGLHASVFRHLLIKNNINPDKDLTIVDTDQTLAATKLISKEIQYAILNEPNSSIALMNAKQNNVALYRSIDLQAEWAEITGKADARIPWAGLIVVGDSAKNDVLIKTVLTQYNNSAKWVNENPAAVGDITVKYFPTMKAPAVTNSIPFSRLEPQSAAQSQELVEEFYNELLKTASPQSIGGKLPDAGFYYQGK